MPSSCPQRQSESTRSRDARPGAVSQTISVDAFADLTGKRALLEGDTLQQQLAASAPSGIPVLSLIDIATQVCLGLEAAHGKDIVPRDIKPANILLTKQGPVKLLDFGG